LALRPATLGVVVLSALIAVLSMVGHERLPIGVRAAFVAVFLVAGWREGTLREVVAYTIRFRARASRGRDG
jgi:hypothetical protein